MAPLEKLSYLPFTYFPKSCLSFTVNLKRNILSSKGSLCSRVVLFPSTTVRLYILLVISTGVGSICTEPLHFDQPRMADPPKMALADSTILLVIFPSSHQITILSTQSLKGKFPLVQFPQP